MFTILVWKSLQCSSYKCFLDSGTKFWYYCFIYMKQYSNTSKIKINVCVNHGTEATDNLFAKLMSSLVCKAGRNCFLVNHAV